MSTVVLAASLAARKAQMIASPIFLISVPRRRAAACDGTSNALPITASARIAKRQIELSAAAHVDEQDRAQEAGILRLACAAERGWHAKSLAFGRSRHYNVAPQPLQEDFIVLTFAVHEAPNPPADRVERAASLLFVKDAFSWPAALFTPLWLIVHRLWWPLLGYLALVALMLEAGSVLAPDAGWIVLGLAALNLLVGLEAAPLRMWSLARRGYSDLGSVTGRTLPECERRFIEAWLPAQPIIAPGAEERNHADRWWRWRPLSTRA